MHGVPMVAIPVANDQPGVSSRIVWHGAGERVLLRELKAAKLQAAIREVLGNPAYRIRCREFQSACRQAGGVQRAVELIEQALATRQPVFAEQLEC